MWLQLTDQDGEPIWINFAAVTAMKGIEGGTRIDTGTAASSGGVHAYHVNESPQEVLEMLEEAYEDAMEDLEPIAGHDN